MKFDILFNYVKAFHQKSGTVKGNKSFKFIFKGSMMGGYSAEGPMEADNLSMVNSMKPAIELKLGRSFSIFVPVSFQSQLVAGMNYKIRVAVNDGKNIYVTIYETLPAEGCTRSITEVNIARPLTSFTFSSVSRRHRSDEVPYLSVLRIFVIRLNSNDI